MAEANNPRPELDAAMMALDATLRANRTLPPRLVELVRLRVAFHNQCRPCMSIRYGDAIDDGLDENLVCALERPDVPSDMTPAEHLAVRYADRFATNHLLIDAAMLADLHRHFSAGEIRELAIQTAFFTGFGRMGAVFDAGEALPVGERPSDGGKLAPWGIDPMVVRL
jgi:AhpD family alkylhydroperoxidase